MTDPDDRNIRVINPPCERTGSPEELSAKTCLTAELMQPKSETPFESCRQECPCQMKEHPAGHFYSMPNSRANSLMRGMGK